MGLRKDDISILYPHRPEDAKGIGDVLKIIKGLCLKGIKRIRLLIPRHIDLSVSDEQERIYSKIIEEADELGIRDLVMFHRWIPYTLMPAYLSLGRLSLSIGSFVESFPNVSLESLACGIPSISSRAGAHRYVLPETIEPKIDVGCIEQATEIAHEILTNPEWFNADKASDYIRKNFDFQKMLERYRKVITGCQKTPPLPLKSVNQGFVSRFGLPAWCYITNRGRLYNDYTGYVEDAELSDLVSMGGAVEIGDLPQSKIAEHLDKGNLIPMGH